MTNIDIKLLKQYKKTNNKNYNDIIIALGNHPDVEMYRNISLIANIDYDAKLWLDLCLSCIAECSKFRFPQYYKIQTREQIFTAWNMFTGFYNPEQSMWRTMILDKFSDILKIKGLRYCSCSGCTSRIPSNILHNLIIIAETKPEKLKNATKKAGYELDLWISSFDIHKSNNNTNKYIDDIEFENKKNKYLLGIYKPIHYKSYDKKRSQSVDYSGDLDLYDSLFENIGNI